jgi:hypothetical protein
MLFFSSFLSAMFRVEFLHAFRADAVAEISFRMVPYIDLHVLPKESGRLLPAVSNINTPEINPDTQACPKHISYLPIIISTA